MWGPYHTLAHLLHPSVKIGVKRPYRQHRGALIEELHKEQNRKLLILEFGG